MFALRARTSVGVLSILLGMLAISACNKQEQAKVPAPAEEVLQGEERAKLTFAPDVPPPITRKHPTKVIVEMETVEKVMELDDGVEYMFWTFNGQVPGPFVRVREGDLIEFHLKNHPTSKMPHNIDLHAVTGPGGGAAASFTAPGHKTQFSFQALKAGLYVYHCATAPVGMHVANGMYGLILVEPKEGLSKVDREYYVMQSEFYTRGKTGEPGLQAFDMEKAVAELADYVVFNGRVGAISGDKALKANVGETVRLFLGNGGPNLVSSFHVIGEIFDKVYVEGGSYINNNVQTTLIPAGGSAIAEFKVEVPGSYHLVDHSIFRAFNKGALGTLKVEGKDNKLIFSGQQSETVYLPEGGTIQTIADEAVEPQLAESREERLAHGERIYRQSCAACHQMNGEGIDMAFPPLASSDYLNESKERAIDVVKNGLTGRIVVNQKPFDSVMPAMALSDNEIASVLTYIYSSWDNKGHEVTTDEVAKIKRQDKPVGAR